VQASPAWTPPSGTLGSIVAEARERVILLRSRATELSRLAASGTDVPALANVLRSTAVGVIAEVKRRSPSKGWINPSLSAGGQALAYEAGGALAISVLTEPQHFGGSVEDLVAVRESCGLPVVKKDFHIDPIQLLEAKAIGASAALLIARALSPARLGEMMEEARRLALEVIVEIRDEDELTRALDAGADIIGINNRNLETLVIDPMTCERLLPRVPQDMIAIAESGVTSRADVERIAKYGADAVLVGSVISAARDPASAVKLLAGVPRVSRER